MGFGKILLGAVIGVGAVAAAPFTGGGSILGAATLAGSLAGTGTMAAAAAAGTMGAAAGAAMNDIEEEEKRECREAGHRDGYRKGRIDALNSLKEKMLENKKLKLGVFALACYVAKLDGYFSPEEQEEIEKAIGRPDYKWEGPALSEEFKNIMQSKIRFNDIVNKYFSDVDKDTINDIDEVIKYIIDADGVVSPEENRFLNGEWAAFKRMH